jgi:hypothetical protein
VLTMWSREPAPGKILRKMRPTHFGAAAARTLTATAPSTSAAGASATTTGWQAYSSK